MEQSIKKCKDCICLIKEREGYACQNKVNNEDYWHKPTDNICPSFLDKNGLINGGMDYVQDLLMDCYLDFVNKR